MIIKKITFLILLSFMIGSCTLTQPEKEKSLDDHALIYQELLSIEHAVLTSRYNLAVSHSKNLDKLLKNGYNLFCPNESAQIDGARLTNHLLSQNLLNDKTSDLLDDLRMLKATIINLETDDDYDPYFAFLWKFEQEMHATTQVAIDPMLDLYEWNEFKDMVDCMNQTWKPVRMHSPSPEFLDHDPVKFKNQTVHKIYLESALEYFNKAVDKTNFEKYPLCESAEAVRSAYIDYINTFIKLSYGSNTMLAKI